MVVVASLWDMSISRATMITKLEMLARLSILVISMPNRVDRAGHAAPMSSSIVGTEARRMIRAPSSKRAIQTSIYCFVRPIDEESDEV